MRETTLLPVWLLAALVALSVALGWVTLELSGSVVAMCVAAAAAWPAVTLARRARAAMGAGPRFAELPSGHLDDPGLRGLGAHLASMIGYFAVALGLMELLSGLDTPAYDVITAGELLALIAAAPVWGEVDARVGVRGLRRRGDEQRRLRALAYAEPVASPLGVVSLPVARLRVTLLAGTMVGFGGLAAFAAADGSLLEQLGLGAAAAGFAAIGLTLGVTVLPRPYFLRVSDDGVDPLGHGLVPWPAIERFEIRVTWLRRTLEVVLRGGTNADRAAWWRKGHRGLGRSSGNAALIVPLTLCGAADEELIAALRSHAGTEVTVEAD